MFWKEERGITYYEEQMTRLHNVTLNYSLRTTDKEKVMMTPQGKWGETAVNCWNIYNLVPLEKTSLALLVANTKNS